MRIETNENEIFIDMGDFERPEPKENVRKNRMSYYNNIYESNEINIGIFVLGYNRVDKTKECIESILKYTSDIKYELILIDNNSTDDTYEYFKSVSYEHKKIVRLSKNTGFAFVSQLYTSVFKGKYYVIVTNDVIVTQNWLSNLMKCIESDDSIGMVSPKSSNVSNLQQVSLNFNNLDEMQAEAKKFNISNPLKWEERIRLINIVSVVKKEVFDLVGFTDIGFFHDFSEDDYSLRVRRAGYKLILCGDTFVHHNHDYWNMENKDPVEFNKSLTSGRNNFKEKYFDIDAWDDVLNFETLPFNIDTIPLQAIPKILAIDVRCGTPILQLRNLLRENNLLYSECHAFTSNAKYYNDLLYVTNGKVKCDRIDYLTEHYSINSFDFIILGEVINDYAKPIQLLQELLQFLKPNGQLLMKLQNIFDFKMLLHMMGQAQDVDSNMPIVISIESILSCLELMKVKNVKLSATQYNMDENYIKFFEDVVRNTNLTELVGETAKGLTIKEYVICITK